MSYSVQKNDAEQMKIKQSNNYRLPKPNIIVLFHRLTYQHF